MDFEEATLTIYLQILKIHFPKIKQHLFKTAGVIGTGGMNNLSSAFKS